MLSNLLARLRKVIAPTGAQTKAGSKPRTEKRKSVSYLSLFRYATKMDIFLVFVSFLFCVIRAANLILSVIVYGDMLALLIDRLRGVGTTSKTTFMHYFGGGKILTNATREENLTELRNDTWSYALQLVIVTVVTMISATISVDLFNLVGLRIIVRLRRMFFSAVIRQDISWHDAAEKLNFTVLMTDNMEKIRDGISEKLAFFIYHIMSLVIALMVSLFYGWKLTLAMSFYIPFVVAANCYVAKYQAKLTLHEQDAYGNAGGLVEETIGAIRTVVAFAGEELVIKRYNKLLTPAQSAGKRKGYFVGFSEGISKVIMFLSTAITFWYGTQLIVAGHGSPNPEYTPAIVMIVLIGVIVGAAQVSKAMDFIDSFASAMGSAVPIYEVIEAASKIDPMSSDGIMPNYDIKGDVEFQDVFFKYPNREDSIVLRGLNLSVRAGETIALVGHTGCGKSTCLQLIHRFYDPAFGNVLLDGVDIRKYNVSWLRSKIATVGQEPVLFQGTIGENIRHGAPEATQKEVESAARAAGAHVFISQLPEGYDTFLSENGVQLSGGQKQRIAIARALIKNPRILLLDEATSALDYNSEKLVQKALKEASMGRTTIVVSHRFSAIQDADRIAYIHEGKVVEVGTHDELMELKSKYFAMVAAHEGKNNDSATDNLKKGIPIAESNGHMNLNRFDKTRFSTGSLKLGRLDKNLDSTNKANTDQRQFFKTFLRIIKVARKQWIYLIIGTLTAVAYGISQPLFAILFAQFNVLLTETDDNIVLQRSVGISIISLIIAIMLGITGFIQSYLFNLAGVSLTTGLRSLTFRTIIQQEIGWFDEEENSVGVLSARLSGDTANLRGAIGLPLSNLIQAAANFICCVAIGFYYSWQLALVCLCITPFMVLSVVYEARFINVAIRFEKRILEETSRIATEALANIRTVAALRREPQLIIEYDNEVAKYRKQLKKRLRIRGVLHASSWAMMYVGYAASVTYGAVLCINGVIGLEAIIMVSESLLFGLMVLAMALAFMPAFVAAVVSGQRLFEIIDREPQIYSNPDAEKSLSVENPSEGIVYRDISFRYPTRPNVKVLNGFNLSIMQGKTVALVGPSGSGKSTCIQLLMRYYDPSHGGIKVDDQDIRRDITLKSLRSRIGIVSQEPVLFERTIAENIAFGDNSRAVPMSEIMEAAKMANAHSFIIALPNGYETKLGARGTELSGGQKQRIAIARSIVRNPRFLLLDEATSALDVQSEKIVQSALDCACSGRTCIIVAHRLTTIQNADLICVLQNGQIVEHGNHSQLLAANGIYAELHRNQPNICESN